MIGDRGRIVGGRLLRPTAGLGLTLMPQMKARCPFDQSAVYSCVLHDWGPPPDSNWKACGAKAGGRCCARHRPPCVTSTFAQVLLAAGVGVGGQADLEAGFDHRRLGFAHVQLVQRHYRLVPHVIGALADVDGNRPV